MRDLVVVAGLDWSGKPSLTQEQQHQVCVFQGGKMKVYQTGNLPVQDHYVIEEPDGARIQWGPVGGQVMVKDEPTIMQCLLCGYRTTDLEANLRKFNEDLCALCGGGLMPELEPEPVDEEGQRPHE